MNSTISKDWIDEQIEADPARNTSEYLAEFRAELESFILPVAVQACVTPGVQERPRIRITRYQAFVDAAGGSGRDSMTMAIAHRQRDGIVVIDAVREVRPYFSPEHVVSEFAALLHSYQVTRVENDRYGGEWVAEQFRKHGIKCEPTRFSKSELYVALLPLLNSGLIQLPDNKRLFQQLVALERTTARGSGKDTVDHPPNGFDDIANAVAGAAIKCAKKWDSYYEGAAWRGLGGESSDAFEDREQQDKDAREYRRANMLNHITGGRGFMVLTPGDKP